MENTRGSYLARELRIPFDLSSSQIILVHQIFTHCQLELGNMLIAYYKYLSGPTSFTAMEPLVKFLWWL